MPAHDLSEDLVALARGIFLQQFPVAASGQAGRRFLAKPRIMVAFQHGRRLQHNIPHQRSSCEPALTAKTVHPFSAVYDLYGRMLASRAAERIHALPNNKSEKTMK